MNLFDFPAVKIDKKIRFAGNAIVRAVLMALFLQLNIQGIKNWNDRTDDEKRALLEEAK